MKPFRERRALAVRLRTFLRIRRGVTRCMLLHSRPLQLGCCGAMCLAAVAIYLGWSRTLGRLGHGWFGLREKDLHTSAPPYMDWNIHGVVMGGVVFFCAAGLSVGTMFERRRLRSRLPRP